MSWRHIVAEYVPTSVGPLILSALFAQVTGHLMGGNGRAPPEASIDLLLAALAARSGGGLAALPSPTCCLTFRNTVLDS
jgi:hypothetical protein